MRKSILLIGALIIALTSCKDDDINYGPAAAGDEVLFSAEHAQFEMNGKDSRTVYGEREGNEYPIYWVNNDEIAELTNVALGCILLLSFINKMFIFTWNKRRRILHEKEKVNQLVSCGCYGPVSDCVRK